MKSELYPDEEILERINLARDAFEPEASMASAATAQAMIAYNRYIIQSKPTFIYRNPDSPIFFGERDDE